MLFQIQLACLKKLFAIALSIIFSKALAFFDRIGTTRENPKNTSTATNKNLTPLLFLANLST